jgi:hypothetical protein
MIMKLKKVMVWQLISVALVIALVVVLYTGDKSGGDALSQDEAEVKMLEFINNNLVQPGTEAEILSVTEENGLYKMEVSLQGQTITSYSSKDGEVFFPQAMVVNAVENEVADNAAPATPPPESPKSDKPKVEAFVMSHCPYGTQIEKGLIPVMETLGDKADIEIKFVNYAMHGEKEVLEQLNQYCIQEEQNAKFIPYLKCFLEEGDGVGCLTKTEIDMDKLETCTTAADTEFEITKNLEDKTNWKGNFPPFMVHDKECNEYGVRGSPSLVINGQTASAGRDAVSLLAAICNAYNEKPEECDTELDAASPSPGFGFATTGAASAPAAGCGA